MNEQSNDIVDVWLETCISQTPTQGLFQLHHPKIKQFRNVCTSEQAQLWIDSVLCREPLAFIAADISPSSLTHSLLVLFFSDCVGRSIYRFIFCIQLFNWNHLCVYPLNVSISCFTRLSKRESETSVKLSKSNMRIIDFGGGWIGWLEAAEGISCSLWVVNNALFYWRMCVCVRA